MMREDLLKFDKSIEWMQRAQRVIPAQTQTFSKSVLQFSCGASPLYAARGEGAFLWDADGNRYIDFTMALCPCILGYSHPVVNEAIVKQLQDGIVLSLPYPLEVEVSERLVELIPCAEMVRFGKNGSDVTAAAVRAARAFTGRNRVAICGYHGWQDWYIATTTRNKGIPPEVVSLSHTFPYNDPDALSTLLDTHPGEFAAVIMEATGIVPPKPGYLQSVLEIAHAHGALVIFDEIINGFRLAIGGAHEYFKVLPDLACFGKAMANGMPISALVGRRDVMKVFNEAFFSFTFGGEALSLAATRATMDFILDHQVLETIAVRGESMMNRVRGLIKSSGLEDVMEASGYGCRWVIAFKDHPAGDANVLKTFFQQECAQRGVLFTGSHNMAYAHEEEIISAVLDVYTEVVSGLKDALKEGDIKSKLGGSVALPVFRKP